jgi:hypothetical protein
MSTATLTRNTILRLADYTAKSIKHASGVLATDFPDCSHFLEQRFFGKKAAWLKMRINQGQEL